jgi:hypothetical protein
MARKQPAPKQEAVSEVEQIEPLPRPPAGAGPSDVDALGEIMLIQGTMHRQFLRVILRRLTTDIPSFQAELFLAELQLMLDSLAAGRDKSALHAFAQKEWERLCEMALEAIASTRTQQERH